jgi:hypothetical protein
MTSTINSFASGTPIPKRTFGSGPEPCSRSPLAPRRARSHTTGCSGAGKPTRSTSGSTAFKKKASPDLPSDPGAGASPLFPPQHEASSDAKEALLRLVRRDPRQFGYDRTRWRLADLLEQCSQWQVATVSGMSGILDRLGISYQRGRDYIHSPDPDYEAKMAYIEGILAQSRACTGRLVALYLDELTYYRQPSLSSAWEERGEEQPRARRSYHSDTPTRVVATLDPADGRVVAWQGSKISIPRLVRFYQQLREAYPGAERFHVIQDNWPIHFHPDVLVALEPQASPWPRYVPSNWPKEPSASARKRWGGLQLPIQLVPLPTYASWENPIEKLWRWGKQEVLHLHRLADHLDELRSRLLDFLHGFENGSQALLRYVGLPMPV